MGWPARFVEGVHERARRVAGVAPRLRGWPRAKLVGLGQQMHEEQRRGRLPAPDHRAGAAPADAQTSLRSVRREVLHAGLSRAVLRHRPRHDVLADAFPDPPADRFEAARPYAVDGVGRHVRAQPDGAQVVAQRRCDVFIERPPDFQGARLGWQGA